MIKGACAIAAVGIALLAGSAAKEWKLVEVVASVLLLPSILMVAALNVYTWRRDKPDRVTFDRMVNENLEKFF